MISKSARNEKAVFSINENRHAMKHKLNYEITKDRNGCSIHANRPRKHLKTRYKKDLPWQLKAGKIKKEVSKN